MVYDGKPDKNGWFGGTTSFGNIHVHTKEPGGVTSTYWYIWYFIAKNPLILRPYGLIPWDNLHDLWALHPHFRPIFPIFVVAGDMVGKNNSPQNRSKPRWVTALAWTISIGFSTYLWFFIVVSLKVSPGKIWRYFIGVRGGFFSDRVAVTVIYGWWPLKLKSYFSIKISNVAFE